MPSDSGVTSRSNTSLTSPLSTPAWIAAPTATTSSGLTPLCGSLPISSLTFACTAGMRVMPPTRTTWSIFEASRPASDSACFVGPTVRSRRSCASSSSFARVSCRSRCFGPSAEVEDEDRLVCTLLVEAVGERGRRRLVDDAQDVQAGDLAGVLRRLALGVVEVGGHRDHRFGDLLAEVGLGVRLQLLEDHRADLRRRVLLAVGLDADVVVRALDDLVGDDLHLLRDLVELPAHEALDREDRVLRVGDLLPPRRGADEPLTVLRERDDGRRRAAALGVRDDGRLAAFEDGHARVRRAEVDADRLCQSDSPSG